MPAPVKDATSALIAGLRAALGAGSGFAVEEVRSRAWASVTFSGARHELALRIDGAGADAAAARFVAGIDAAEIHLDGHLLADLSLVSEERRPGCARIRVEALTVCDA